MKMISTIVCLAVFLLSGCTALLWQENRSIEKNTVKNIQIEDNITSVFQYKNLSAAVIQGRKEIALPVPSEGLAFLGEEYIYILTQGASDLLTLNKMSARIPLNARKASGALELKLISAKKGDAVIGFVDTLHVKVIKDPAEIMPEDINIIDQLGFRLPGRKYEKFVNLKGIIIPRRNFPYPFEQPQTLEKSHKIYFYTEEKETEVHPLKLAANIVLTPMALAADIIFIPISLNVLELMQGSRHNSFGK